MSDIKDDGGPAFPIPEGGAWDGLSLRDWFAGQALAGMLASPHCEDNWVDDEKDDTDEESERSANEMSGRAYQLANAMLAERDLLRKELKQENVTA